MVLKQQEILNTRKEGRLGPNLLSLDGLVGRLGVLCVAAGYSGDGGHHNLSALNLALQLWILRLYFAWGQLGRIHLPGKTSR